jgi:hypothetical protein
MMFGSVQGILLTFGMQKDAKLVFAPECTISGYQSFEASILVYWNQNDFGSVSKHFPNLRHVRN